MNDSFYLQNIKGIKNLGYHYNSNHKNGLGGENIGLGYFISYQFKLIL